jgi:hypothetical protein
MLVGLALVGITAVIYLWSARREPGRIAIEGNVSLDGKNLNHAVIVFVPEHTEARKTGAEIIDGKYRLAEQDGLSPGTYRVEISPYVSPLLKSEGARAINPPSIPQRYNRQSKLKAVVSGNPGQTINFPLSSQP